MLPPSRWARGLSLASRSETRHASAVAIDGRGVLILGASGSGKSALVMELISLGALLISDDQTRLSEHDGVVMLDAPAPIRGMVEARGVGLLNAPTCDRASLHVVVDLSGAEPERLPPQREMPVMGRAFPLILGQGIGHLGPALCLMLRYGRAH